MDKTPVNTQDNLTKLMLVALGLTVVIAIVVACLPAKSNFGQGWQQAFASMTHQMRLPHKQWSASELQKGRHQVSYQNPQVRRTLNIPWASN